MLSQQHGISQLELFLRTEIAPNLQQLHKFGCPVYTLHSNLQSVKFIPKWNPRSRLGVNLGPSPRHRRQVSLILNLMTRLVSLQYHVIYDDYFETTSTTSGNPMTNSTWQKLAGLTIAKYDQHVSNQVSGGTPNAVSNNNQPQRATLRTEGESPKVFTVKKNLAVCPLW